MNRRVAVLAETEDNVRDLLDAPLVAITSGSPAQRAKVAQLTVAGHPSRWYLPELN